MISKHLGLCPIAALAGLSTMGCAPVGGPGSAAEIGPREAAVVALVTGFTGPEAVRYDPDQDVYFVSNFGPGNNMAQDNNGFISRMDADGSNVQREFMRGDENVRLHAPRGIFIVGDTLWVADADGVKGFNRRTGAPVASIDIATGRQVIFLNDVAASPDGTLYVTDTGTNTIYRVSGRTVSVATQDANLNRPNGITYDNHAGGFIIVGGVAARWRPDSAELQSLGTSEGSRWDGVEVLPDGRVLAASLGDTALYIFDGGSSERVIQTSGLPADIGLDTRRWRVAVPSIALDQVEIWDLPR